MKTHCKRNVSGGWVQCCDVQQCTIDRANGNNHRCWSAHTPELSNVGTDPNRSFLYLPYNIVEGIGYYIGHLLFDLVTNKINQPIFIGTFLMGLYLLAHVTRRKLE